MVVAAAVADNFRDLLAARAPALSVTEAPHGSRRINGARQGGREAVQLLRDESGLDAAYLRLVDRQDPSIIETLRGGRPRIPVAHSAETRICRLLAQP